MDNDMIVKSNNLIDGFMDMTQNEYKFTLYLISKIKKDDKDFKTKSVAVQEFAELIDYKGHNLYEYMKDFEESLASKKITILYQNGDRLNIPWFGYLKYKKRSGILEVAFNNYLVPFLLSIDTNFTKYFLNNVKNLNSFYAIRMYEILKQYEKLKERKIELEELRQMLGITPSQYKLYGHFKDKVILKAQKEINTSNNTDISFNFEEIKQGRKVVAVKFMIKSKKKAVSTIDDVEQLSICETASTKQMLSSESIIHKNKPMSQDIEEIIKQFKNIYGAELNYQCTKKMVEEKGIDHIRKCLYTYSKVSDKRNIRNIAGDFFACVMQGYTEPVAKKSVGYVAQKENFEQRKYTDEEYEDFYTKLDYTDES